MTGLYVHLPFCIRKCPYCAFFSVSGAEEQFAPYVQRLIKEAHRYPEMAVDSIYFGGGTPTVLPVALLTELLRALLERFPCTGEITIEANPATISPASLSALHSAGFNRISLGVQSLLDKELQLLGRLHTAEDALYAVAEAEKAGFSNISADVMFGLPGQSVSDTAYTVQRLAALPISHVSAYSLSVEPGTPYALQKLRPAEEETEREMYYTIRNILHDNGFMQYEISNFALPGKEAVHNTNYWLCGEYIGLGAGAHGFFDGIRYENVSDISAYVTTENAVCHRQIITDADKYEEKYMLGLRMCVGIPDDGNPKVGPLVAAGFLERTGGNIRLTARGMDIANTIITELLT